MELRTFLLVAFLAGAFASPFWGEEDDIPSSTSCAATCPDTAKFSYELGKTYQYSYSSSMETTVAGAMDEMSTLHMTATVNLEVLSQCEMAIRLSDVALQDADPTSRSREYVENAWDFKRALQARSIRFAFMDGHIDNICPDPEEEHWVKNLKKGIISAFQNRMPSFETNTKLNEIDISGDCPVSYEISSRNWGTIYIRKTKSLLSCANRQHLDSVMQGTPYRVPSKLQSLPILKGESYCDQEINSNGILAQSQCHETHIYRPFSKHESGAKTTVTGALVYQGVTNGVRAELEHVGMREDMLFEHKSDAATDDDETRTRQQAQRVLRELCDATENDIRPEVPALFSKLVREMRMLDTSNLNALFQVFRNDRLCEKAKKFFTDAIPMLGTTSSIGLIRDLIQSGDIVADDAEVWLTSLTFISNPTLEMLNEAKPLLQMEPRDRRVALSISSMVNAFCKNNECSGLREIQNLMAIFEEDLRYNCVPSNDDQYDRILMSLKAIGNAGFAHQVPALMRCAENEDAPLALRVAAISAFRRMPCDAETAQLAAILRDATKESELRIMSYLALMQCPDMHIINMVVEILRTEEVNQVGSFMWTHLTNLMESSHVFKQEIREILEDEHLEKEFDLDKRKFSRNIEWSAFSEWLNVGGMVESNLIWSTKSFVPAAWSLNTTVDMFGESFNMMEIGGRMEGIDQVLEKIFNPNAGGDEDEVRSASNAINRIDSQYMQDPVKQPEISYYLRFFGNEIKYDDFRNIDFTSLQDRFNYLQWLIDLSKEHVFDMTKSFMFMESTISVPTIVGVPLKLTMEGSAVMEAKVNGHLDLRQIHTPPRSINIQGSIKPSSAIEISGEMGVDMNVAKTGVKMVNTLHTSTVADSHIELRDGQVFSVDINTPQDKIEVFSVQSKFYLVYRDQEREQEMLSADRVEHRECFGSETMTHIIGMELCGEVGYPAVFRRDGTPFPPLTGPMDAKLELYKRDTMSSYHFEAKMLKERVNTANGIEVTDIAKLSFETPDSQVDREFTIDYQLNRAEKALRLNLRCPWKKADMTGAFVTRDDLSRMTGHVIVDDAQEYGMTAELQIDNDGPMKRYAPSLEITIPEMQPIRMSGSVTYRPWKRLSFDMNMDNIFEERVSMSANAALVPGGKRNRYNLEADMVSPIFRSNVNGFINVQKDGAGGSGRLELDYTLPGRNPVQDRMTLSSKWRDEPGKNGRRDSSISGTVSSSRYPTLNGEFNVEMEKSRNSITTTLEAGPEQRRKKLTIQQTFTDRSSDDEMNYAAGLTVTLPAKRIDYTLNTEQIWSDTQARSMVTLEYGPRRSASYELNYEIQSMSPLRTTINGRLEYPGRQWILTETVEERAPREFHYDMTMQFTPDDIMRITSMYKDEPRYEITSDISIPEMNPISIRAHLKPSLSDLQSHMEFRYDNYLFQHTTTHQGDLRQFDTESSLQIGYAERLIQSSAEAHRRGQTLSGSFETKYDVRRNAEKKVKLTGEISLNSERPSLTMRTEWYPSKFAEITTSGSYAHDGWWSARRNMQGDMTLRSSYPSMEEMTLSLRHNSDDRQITTHAEFTPAPRKTWVADFNHNKQRGWNQIDSTLTLTGPMRQTYGSNLSWNKQRNSMNINHETTWNGQRMALTFNGNADLQPRSLDCSITFTSPFVNYEDLAFTVRHNDNGRNFDSEMEVHMNGRSLTGTFTMQHDRRGWSITNSGSLTVNTPFDGYRTNKLIWRHENNENLFQCHHEMQMEGGDTVLDISATKSINSRARNFELTSSFTSPFEPVRDLSLAMSHSDEVNTMENIISRASFQWAPRKMISMENELHIDPYRSVRKSFTFSSPFRGYERITLNVNNALEGNTFTTHKEMTWGNNQRMVLDGHIMIDALTMDSHMELVTPFEGVERIVMNLANNKDRNIWVTTGDLEYAPRKQIQFTAKLGTANLKKLSLDLQTPFESMTSLAFDIEHRGRLRDFTSRATFDMQPDVGAYSANIRVNANDIHDMRASVNFESPIRNLRFMRLIATHSHSGDAVQTTELTFEMPRYSMTANNVVTFHSIRDFATNTQVTYDEGRTIGLVTAFSLDPSLAMSATFTSPFRNFEEISFEINHAGTVQNFRSNGHVAMSPSERFAAEVEFNKDGSDVNGRASLTTPPSYNDAAVVFGHQGNMRSFRSNGELSYGRRRYAGNVQFNNRRNNMNGEFTLTVPSLVSDITGSFSHEISPDSMQSSAELTLPDGRYATSAGYGIENRRKTATISYSTPYRGDNTATATVDGTLNNFRAEAEATCGHGRRWSLNTDFLNDYSRKSGSLMVRLPYSGWESNSASFTMEGTKTNFRSNAEATIKGQRMGANAEMNIDAPSKTMSVAITTPVRGYEQMGASAQMNLESPSKALSISITTPIRGYENNVLTISHTGGWSDFSNEATLEYGRERISSNNQFSKNNEGITMSSEIRTPFPALRTLIITGSHSGKWKSFTNRGSFSLNGATYSQTTIFKLVPKNGVMRFSSELTTPGKDYSVSLNHRGTLASCTSELSMNWGRESLTANTELTWNDNRITASGRMTTPFSGYENFQADINHRGDLQQFRSSGSITTPWFTGASYEMNHRMTPRRLENSGNVQIPNYPRLDFELNHSATRNEMSSSTSMSYDGRSIGGDINMRKTSDGFEITGNLQTPCQVYRTVAFELSKSGSLRDFSISGSISSNGKTLGGSVAYSKSGNTISASASVQTPFTGYENMALSINHDGTLQDFTTTVTVEIPFEILPRCTVTVSHAGTMNNFRSSMIIEYNNKHLEGSIVHSFESSGGYYSASAQTLSTRVQLSTPYPAYNFDGQLEGSYRGGVGTVNLDFTYMGEKIIDADYTVNTGSEKSLTINVREPRSTSIILSYEVAAPSYTAHAAVTDEGRSYIVDLTTKYQVDASASDIALTLTANLHGMEPKSFSINYHIDDTHVVNAMNFNDIYSYSFEVNKVERRRQTVVDGTLAVTTPTVDYQIVMSHTCIPGRSYVTEMTFGRREPLTIRHELTVATPDYTSSLTISSPRLSNDISFEVAGTVDLETPILDGRITTMFENERIEFTGRIAQESTSSLKKFVSAAQLTHPGTFTDMSWTGDIEWTSEQLTMNAEFNYQMTRDRSMQTCTLTTVLNKARKEIDIRMANPLMRVEYNGRITELDLETGTMRAEITASVDDAQLRSELALIMRDPSADLKVYYGDSELFHFHAGYPDDRSINIEAFHTLRGERIRDAQVALSLASSRILQTSLYLRPTIMDDLTATPSYGYGQEESYLAQAIRATSEELRYKKSYATRSFSSIIQWWEEVQETIKEKYNTLKVKVDRKMDAMENKIRTMYYNNEYHLRDIYDKLEEYYEIAQEKVNEWTEAYNDQYYVYGDTMRRWGDSYNTHYNNFYNHMSGYGQRIREHTNTMHSYMTDMYSRHASPIINSQVVQRVISISQAEYERVYSIRDKYEQMVTELKNMWRQLEQRPEYIKAREWVMNVVEHSQWWYEFLEIEEMIVEKIREIRSCNFDTMKAKILEKLREITGMDRSRFTVWNPRGGEIAADIYLPVEMTSLRQLPTINYQRYVNKIKNMINRYLPASDFNFWDTYYKYKPSSDIANWVPPFKDHATIAGSQFFYTFDHHFFEYSGECSYLLARDFVDGNFSVIVNYGNVQGQMTKKSITVSTEGHEVELYPDFKVLLDGNRVEMPIQFTRTSIVREGNMIKLHNDHGLDVTCNLPYDSCTIGVSGWYYSKTAGLLGTYNNEPSDDFITPDHSIVTEPEVFADSWTVGRRCTVVNNAHIAPVNEASRRHRECAAMFEEESSPFRPCFKLIDPSAAMKMCLDTEPRDVNSLSEEVDVCQSSSFYINECDRHGVALRMPSSCIRCELSPRKAFYESQEVTIAEENGDFRLPESADIVFVASHGVCNQEVRDRMSNLISLMEKAMKVENLRNNMYSLIGYGGEGVNFDAQPHTMDGKIFNNKAKIIQAINDFETLSRDIAGEDSLSAIRYAADLSFRPGVSKTIILLPCVTCHETPAATYSQIQQLLSHRDIRLHVVMDHEFTLKASSPKTSFIFGVDRNSMYNSKHVDQSPLEGDSDLRPHVNVPKDICAALAELTDGSVFNVRKLTQSRPFVQKKFIDIFTRLVAKKAEPTDCQKCECIADETGVGKSMCRRCHALTADEMVMPMVQQIIEEDTNEQDLEEDIQEVLKPKKFSQRKQKERRQQKMKTRKNKKRQQ